MICELNINNETEFFKIKEFLIKNDSDYMQDINWNIIRNESKKYFLFCVEDNDIIWTCSLLQKENSEGQFLYAPRGPVLKNSDFKLLNCFLDEIQDWMKIRNYFKLVINPYITYSQLSLISNRFCYQITNSKDYSNLMDSCKLAVMDIIFDEDALINKLPSKFRQNIRRSYRKNLIFKLSKHVDLNNFYDLYIQTSKRHNFHPHTKSYFEKILNVYKNELIFLEVWHEEYPLAMSIDIIHNNKLIYLYGVSSSEYRNLLGMYYLQWEAIRYCIKNNLPKYDFGGVFCDENDFDNKDYGLYTFKKGFCYNGFIDIVPDITFTIGGNKND